MWDNFRDKTPKNGNAILPRWIRDRAKFRSEWTDFIARVDSRMGSYFAVIRELGQATPVYIEKKIRENWELARAY